MKNVREKKDGLIYPAIKKEKTVKEEVLDLQILYSLQKQVFIHSPNVFIVINLGHMKINCHKRMIEYIFHRIKEDSERKKRRIEQNEMERKKKEEIKEIQLEVLKDRAQYLDLDSLAQLWSNFGITYSNGNRFIC